MVDTTPNSNGNNGAAIGVLREPAETRYADELARLTESDKDPRPQGWHLSPKAVRRFILGDENLDVTRKFYGDDPLIDRCVVSLLGHQGLMLVGEPGTAKSMLSELLAAAISGNSNLVVQGTAGTTEDHVKYSWNYALLLAEGPSERSLVPSPIYQGMERGAIVRFEEITRCPPEIQDAMISLLSEKQMMIPELGDNGGLSAQRGFNVIATANLRDRGVHEMSSALKRRFNFETVFPIADKAFEMELVMSQLQSQLEQADAPMELDRDVIELLVTTFQDLRTGRTEDGVELNRPTTVMSTAEAVNVAFAAALEARYFDGGKLHSGHLAKQLRGSVLKDDPEDAKKVRQYFDVIVKDRARRSKAWSEFYKAGKALRFD